MKQSAYNGKSTRKSKFVQLIIIGFGILLLFNYIYQNSSLYYRKSFKRQGIFSLHLNSYDLYLVKGEEYRLHVHAINKRVSFTTTNFRVAGVNFNGRIYAHQPGVAFIIAKVDERELKCRVHVMDINKEKLNMKVGNIRHLSIQGSNSYVRWKSSNPKVASVSWFGIVKAKRKGTAVISAKIKGKVLRCSVRVR